MNKKYRLIPPGVAMDGEIAIIVLSIFVFLVLLSLPAFQDLNALAEYVKYNYGIPPVYYEGKYSINDLIGGHFAGLWLHIAVCAALALRNCRSFHSPVRSIYTAKRSCGSKELSTMRFAVPLIGVLAGIAASAFLILIFYINYLHAVPESIPGSYKVLNIWRALL